MSFILEHMSWIWQFALPFVVVLGVVVLFHEFGHYLVAKWLGVTVEVFSVGFGPRIFGFRRGGTDYRVSWVPLGGYVKLKGETPEETSGSLDPGDLMSRSRFQRFLVFVMGAVFNLITAYVLTVAILMMGIQEPIYPSQPPVVGEIDPDSPAVAAGIQPGDRILSIGGQPVTTWKELEWAILLSPGQTKEVVLEHAGRHLTVQLPIQADTRNSVGILSFGPATGVIVSDPQPGRPAEKADLRSGDRIVSIDGVAMTTIGKVIKTIQASPGKPLHFVIQRGGETLEKVITPVREGNKGVIGFLPTPPMTTRSYGFVDALGGAMRRNLDNASLMFLTLKKLFLGELSLRSFSGPIGLYLASGVTAQEGLSHFLEFIAFVSLQLGIINLFPIPPLDGGHVFTLMIEGTIRRDLSVQLKERVMQAGLVLLLLFMATVIYLDISKLFPR
ncbi:MAG: RIP metalloprotease RseP [Acidobacteria bacterium]|nr:MAG: RIP metalloprotease RseP [Acidobacteriota bacterium]